MSDRASRRIRGANSRSAVLPPSLLTGKCPKCGHPNFHHTQMNGCTIYVEKLGAECGCLECETVGTSSSETAEPVAAQPDMFASSITHAAKMQEQHDAEVRGLALRQVTELAIKGVGKDTYADSIDCGNSGDAYNAGYNDAQRAIEKAILALDPSAVERAEREIRLPLIESLETLSSDKVCAWDWAQKRACRCCHASAEEWQFIEHKSDCDVLKAHNLIRAFYPTPAELSAPGEGEKG